MYSKPMTPRETRSATTMLHPIPWSGWKAENWRALPQVTERIPTSIMQTGSASERTIRMDYYFITNLQGDVLQVFRESDGEIVAAYTYDSWGNILRATGDKAEENPFRYRGYYYDVESGILLPNVSVL